MATLDDSIKIATIKSESTSSDSNSIDADFNIQEVYNELFDELVKINKINKKLQNKDISIENEKNNLFEVLKIDELETLTLKTQMEKLEKELKVIQNGKQDAASQKLEHILSMKKI